MIILSEVDSSQLPKWAQTLIYIAVNFVAGPLYKPEDVFWGQLAGCLEALDAGTTTVVDHSHINHAPENGMVLPLLNSYLLLGKFF